MELHRIEIPEMLGGGWVDIKARRSWKDSNRAAGAGFRVRAGVTQEEMELAQREKRTFDLMELDAHSGNAVPLEMAIVATSEELLPAGMSVRAWLDSDELSEDLGDFLLEAVKAHYESLTRSADERKT